MSRSFVLAGALAAASLFGLALSAEAGRPDAMLPVKTTTTVEIESPGQVVTFGVLLTESSATKVALALKAAKKSPLVPEVRLVAPDGSPFDPASAGSVKAKGGSWSAKFTGVAQKGLWLIEVTGKDGTTGACSLKLAATEKLKLSDSRIVPVNFAADFPFSVGDDQEISVTAKRGKGSQIVPQLEILDPNGIEVETDGLVKSNSRAGTAVLKKFRLPVFGDYTLRLRGDAGVGGTVAFTIQSKGAKLSSGLPVVNPGPSFEGEPGSTVRLNGSATPSNPGTIYRWTQVQGDPVELSDPLSPTPMFTAPNTAQSLVFQLSADTSGNLGHAVPVVVNIGRRPVADAGVSRVVGTNAAVTLDGRASFNRSTRPLRYLWTQAATDSAQVSLDDPRSAQPTFTSPNVNTTLHFDLVVDDGEVRSFPNRVTVSVGGSAVADAGRDQFVARMSTVHLSGLRSVRPGVTLGDSLQWTQVGGPTVLLDGATSPFPSFTAPKFATDLAFELTVDGDAATKDRVEVHVRQSETNLPAQISTTRPTSVASGNVTLAATSTDPNGNALRFAWGQLEGAAAPLADATVKDAVATLPTGPDAYVFAVQTHDGLQYGAPDLCWATNTGYAGGPIADAGTDRVAPPNTQVFLDGRRSIRTDGGAGALTYHWEQISGTDWFDVLGDATFDPTASNTVFRLPATISSLTSSRTVSFALTVSDGTTTSEPDVVTVTFGGIPLNGLPIVTASASQVNPVAGGLVQLSATVEELDGDPLTFLWTRVSGPSVSFSPNPTVLNPTIVAPQSGTVVLRFVASDPFDSSAPAQISLTVDRKPTAVVVVSPAVGDVGTLVTVDGRTSSDPEGADISYTWTQTDGDAVTFDPNAAVFSFTAAGNRATFRLVVNDGRQSSDPATGSFSVSPPPDITPSASLTRAPYGATVQLQANPTSTTTQFTYTWRQINSGSDPSVTLSSTTAQNPTFGAPVPTSVEFGGSDFNGPNESLPSATFGVIASNGIEQSQEKTVTVKFFASMASTATSDANKVEMIVQNKCASCHSGSSASGSCGSSSNATFYGLGDKTGILNGVNGNNACSSGVRLSPGNPNSSSFWTRINGSGGTMPPQGNTALSATEKLIIKDWISQGCKDN